MLPPLQSTIQRFLYILATCLSYVLNICHLLSFLVACDGPSSEVFYFCLLPHPFYQLKAAARSVPQPLGGVQVFSEKETNGPFFQLTPHLANLCF